MLGDISITLLYMWSKVLFLGNKWRQKDCLLIITLKNQYQRWASSHGVEICDLVVCTIYSIYSKNVPWHKGLFTNYVRSQRGGRWKILTMANKGGGGLRQMLTTEDKQGRGGRTNADIGWQTGVGLWVMMKSLKKWQKLLLKKWISIYIIRTY